MSNLRASPTLIESVAADLKEVEKNFRSGGDVIKTMAQLQRVIGKLDAAHQKEFERRGKRSTWGVPR